jgi:hypothetical protein
MTRAQDPGFLIRSSLYNARRMAKAEFKRKQNWVLAMELFLCGSSMAHEMCKIAEVDPDGLQFDMWTGYPAAKECTHEWEHTYMGSSCKKCGKFNYD